MIRTLLEYVIERALDQGRRPPGWLRWLARHDSRLYQHSQQALQLDRALRSAAVTRRHELATDTSAVPLVEPVIRERAYLPAERSAARWSVFAAIAATLVCVAAFASHYQEQQANAARAQFVSTKLAEVPDDMLAMIAEAARSSREFSPIQQIALPEVNPWRDIPRGTQGQLKQSFSAWGSQLSDLGERVYQRYDLRGETEIN